MTGSALRFAQSIVVASGFLFLPFAATAQTEIETKGIPFKGSISGGGREIATISFFGEGTTKIRFEGNQDLILKDSQGKIVAGFEISALDPKVARPTQLYLCEFKEDGKNKTLAMEQKVTKAEFRNGQYNIADADTNVLTSFFADEKQLSVVYGSVVSQKTPEGQVINVLTLRSPEGEEFVFSMEPSSTMQCRLTPKKGDIVRYLRTRQQALTRRTK